MYVSILCLDCIIHLLTRTSFETFKDLVVSESVNQGGRHLVWHDTRVRIISARMNEMGRSGYFPTTEAICITINSQTWRFLRNSIITL